jgi:hypothetical protein
LYTVAITETEKTQVNCVKYVVITLGQTETDNINLIIVQRTFLLTVIWNLGQYFLNLYDIFKKLIF